jgi:hypothetical protein
MFKTDRCQPCYAHRAVLGAFLASGQYSYLQQDTMILILFLCVFAARVGSRYEWVQKVVVINDDGIYSSVAVAVPSFVQKIKCMTYIVIAAV